ncbi:MAG: dihydroorotate dehydrogenase [Desulfovibrio sp.]|nr:dihydroorotate dehydrogenase [Desulfovibrio sp.]
MDLSVTLRGQRRDLNLKNPVHTASGPFGSGLEYTPFGNLGDLGGIVVKGISLLPREGNPYPRIAETTAGMLNAIGLQNDGVEKFLNEKLPLLPFSETAILANLYATSPEEFGELAGIFNEVEGIAALEVNVSCPNVRHGGAQFGQDAKLAAEVTARVREMAPDKHIMVKLSPNVTDIREIARSVEAAGADSISCINTLLGMAVNARTRRPMLANIVGGLSGPAIKPVALRCVWQVASAVRIPVIGIGGICCVDDIIEFLLCGAQAVQIGTANFMHPRAAFELAANLPAALEEYGFTSAADACGKIELPQ